MNIISAVDDNINTSMGELKDEKEKCLKRLAEIYAELARLEFVASAVLHTKHFVIELPKTNV